MTHMVDQPSAVFEPVDRITPLWTLDRKHKFPLSRRIAGPWKGSLADWTQEVPAAQIHGVFDGDDLAIIRTAYLEACAFLGPNLKPRQKAEIAFSVLSHA